jgi:hypothetical protein
VVLPALFLLPMIFSLFLLTPAYSDEMERSGSPDGAVVHIIEPQSNQVLDSPVKVVFGLRNMGVAPAGVYYPNTGHHHLLINKTVQDMGVPLPTGNSNVLHFGGGQTEAMVKLVPGKYTLQLLMGDSNHVPHEPPVQSKIITITVK